MIQTSGKLGWTVRSIVASDENGTVMLDDGVSFSSPCFAHAQAGDIWAVHHEPGSGCFGQVRQAVLLSPARLARGRDSCANVDCKGLRRVGSIYCSDECMPHNRRS